MFKKLILIFVDFVLLSFSLFISYSLRSRMGDADYDFRNFFILFIPVFVFWQIVFYIQQLYDYFRFSSISFVIYNILRSSIANFIITIIFFYVIPNYSYTPKTTLIFTIIFSIFLLVLWRYLFNALFAIEPLRKKIIIIGNGKIEFELAEKINNISAYGYKMAGLVLPDSSRRNKKIKTLGYLKNLPDILKKRKIDTLALDINSFRQDDQIFAVISDYCIPRNIEVVDVFLLYEQMTGQIPLENFGQIWFTNFNQPVLRWHNFFKRIIDIIFGLIGLGLFIPIIPLLYILVKIDSTGPFFYAQERIGLMGQPFKIYKIRTMKQNSEDKKAVWAQAGDKRVTFLGKILRRTSIDELPQFFNILIGQMSLVGPRPERPEFITKLGARQKLYYKRHLVKPGLTGWAQINLGYGQSFSDSDDKLRYDLYYIKNRSVFIDLMIILRTFRLFFINRGGN